MNLHTPRMASSESKMGKRFPEGSLSCQLGRKIHLDPRQRLDVAGLRSAVLFVPTLGKNTLGDR